MTLPLKAKAEGAVGMQGPFWPPDHVLDAQGPAIPDRAVSVATTLTPTSPGFGSPKDRVLSTAAATIAFLMLLFSF